MTTKVPTALHAELEEYTSLVRALRTARTLDITAHLLQATENDGWTQWPLIDCPVPEWSLADEIVHLGQSVLHQRRPTRDNPRDDDGALDLESDSDLDSLPSSAANPLVLHTGAVLVHILNLLADQRPSAPGSMQNRLWPMNWEDVISLLAVSGVVHPTVIARTQRRLERIYGPSSTSALTRLTVGTAAKTRFTTLCGREDPLFAPPILHPRTCRKENEETLRRRQSTRHRFKTPAVVDTDTDTAPGT